MKNDKKNCNFIEAQAQPRDGRIWLRNHVWSPCALSATAVLKLIKTLSEEFSRKTLWRGLVCEREALWMPLFQIVYQ